MQFSTPPPQKPQASPQASPPVSQQRLQQTPPAPQSPSNVFQRKGGVPVWPQELNREIDRVLRSSRQEERDFIKQVFSKYHHPTSKGATEQERDKALKEIEKTPWISRWTKDALKRGLGGA